MIIAYSDAYRRDLERLAYLAMSEGGKELPIDIDKGIRGRAVLLHERRGRIDGVFIGALSTYWFNDEKIAVECLFYVEPQARGSRAAVELLGAAERWAKAVGAREMYMGQMSGHDMDRIAKFYEHCGYRVIGVNCVKELT